MLMVKSRLNANSPRRTIDDSNMSIGNFDTAARLAADTRKIRSVAYQFKKGPHEHVRSGPTLDTKNINVALKGSLCNIRKRIIDEREEISPEKLSFVHPISTAEDICKLERPLIKSK